VGIVNVPRLNRLLLGSLLFAWAGCQQPHRGWEPPLEEMSTRFLRNQVEEALDFVHVARQDVRADPAQLGESLDGAERALERMSKYYLPLLEARDCAYDAHRFLYYGERSRAKTKLATVEGILDSVAEAGGAALQPVLKEPLDLVSEARAAVMAGTDTAPHLIESLTVTLNLLALKGGLDLPDDWPETPRAPSR
jgi:hypothetical protein